MSLPESFLNCDVTLALAIPMPGPGGQGLTFPQIEGKILSSNDKGIEFKNAKGEEMWIEHARLQHIMKTSQIARPSGIVTPIIRR